MDLTKLSDADLRAISEGRITDVSDFGLKIIASQEPSAPKGKPTFAEAAMPEIIRPEFRQEVGRQAALAARAVPAGIASTLGIVGDPLNALINLITGSRLQTLGGAAENLLTRAGLPEPSGETERMAYEASKAISGVALPAAAIPRLATAPISAAPARVTTPQQAAQVATERVSTPAERLFTENIGTQATGAAGGTLAAQLAAQMGAGLVGQVAAGLAGGVVAPGAVQTAGTRGVSGGREVIRPFTESGQEVIAGNVLRQLSAQPETAAARAAAFEPRVPGYIPTTAQATRDVGLVSAEPSIRAMDTTGRFIAKQSAANQARMTILDRMAKDKSDIENAVNKRNEITDPLREQAFARSTITPEAFQSNITLTVNKTIDDILQSPSGRRGTVMDVMNDAKTDIFRARTPQELYEIRKDLRAAQLGQLDKSGRGGPSAGAYKVAGTQLNEVIKSVDDAIEVAAPGYKDYLSKYAKASRGIESLEAAQAFRSKVLLTTPDPITGQYLISQPAFTRAIREIEKGGFEGLSQTQVAILKKVSKDLDDGVLTRAGKMPGSDTFKNMSTANVIGGIIGKQIFGETSPFLQKVTAPMNWLYNGTDDRIRELLVDAMLDPKLASRLMGKATTTNLESIGQELQRRAINLGYGSIFGLTE